VTLVFVGLSVWVTLANVVSGLTYDAELGGNVAVVAVVAIVVLVAVVGAVTVPADVVVIEMTVSTEVWA
jgi:hypothetical protein